MRPYIPSEFHVANALQIRSYHERILAEHAYKIPLSVHRRRAYPSVSVTLTDRKAWYLTSSLELRKKCAYFSLEASSLVEVRLSHGLVLGGANI